MAPGSAPPWPQRILVAHNRYQQRGGEDAVVEDEIALLRSHGHEVLEYGRSNFDLDRMGRLSALAQTVWSTRTEADLKTLLASFRPDVVHVHNTFPLISPSLYWAAHAAAIPVVQTLHNFRLLCPQAMLLREGRVCEDCVGKSPWRGVVHACYRDSVAQSAAVATMLVAHRALGTWDRKVSRYIALNEFCRRKFIEGGLPAERISVKPNFVDLPASEATTRSGFLFVGRLSPEKGIDTLIEASKLAPDLRIAVAGAGPASPLVQGAPHLDMLGPQPAAEVYRRMRQASVLLLPSIWYENFPRTIVEAFACGLPVIASRLGAMAEIVEDGRTGLLFEPGNAADLAAKMRWSAGHPDEMLSMGRRARAAYEAGFTAKINYERLLEIYREVRYAVH